MNFKEQLNDYIDVLDCTAKALSEVSGISPATLSRYRKGERIPKTDSEAFKQLCGGLAVLASKDERKGLDLTEANIEAAFLQCSDMIASDDEAFRRKLNLLITELAISPAKLSQYTNYESSALFRIRNGSRHSSDPAKLTADTAKCVVREIKDEASKNILLRLIGGNQTVCEDEAKLFESVRHWLISGSSVVKDDVTQFLEQLNNFDLNEYIKSIHFDALRVPTMPFQLPKAKNYTGLDEMMTAELDFLKATVLSKSKEPVIMYSDMPMEEMSKDPEFPKKWMFGMAMMLKKGLHLSMIHNLDRPFYEMLLGLEGYIPMYMTGQVTPYYLKHAESDTFLHLLKVSGSAALSGEAIVGCHQDGRYRLTKSKEEVAYYKKRANQMLDHAFPVMDIYRCEHLEKLHHFIRDDALTAGKRRSILSAPPIFTIDRRMLKGMLERSHVTEKEREMILSYVDAYGDCIEDLLQSEMIEDEIPVITREEFEKYPMMLSLSGIFSERDIPYTFEEYQKHLAMTEAFAQNHENYHLKKTASCAFRNLQIHIHEGKWAMVSKSKSPAIHFVIHHKRLCAAIEHFVPPIVE